MRGLILILFLIVSCSKSKPSDFTAKRKNELTTLASNPDLKVPVQVVHDEVRGVTCYIAGYGNPGSAISCLSDLDIYPPTLIIDRAPIRKEVKIDKEGAEIYNFQRSEKKPWNTTRREREKYYNIVDKENGDIKQEE